MVNDNINELLNNIESGIDKTAEIKVDESNMELFSDDYPASLPLKIKSFESDKDYVKFIKSCEKMVRGSQEFSLWRNYVRNVLGVNKCEITNETIDDVTIEIHHHLPDLFTLMKAIINKKIENKESFSTFDVSLECINLHYLNRVGYIPLAQTLHEKVHSGTLQIPLELIKGGYQYFIDEYLKYLEDDDVEEIHRRLSINKENFTYNGWTKDNYPGLNNANNRS